MTPEHGAAEERERAQLSAVHRVLSHSGMTVDSLWRRYFALGGGLGPLKVDAYVSGLTTLPALDRDLLAQALNEAVGDHGPRAVPFSRVMRDPRPLTGPLAAVLAVLEGMHLAEPGRIAAVTAAAGEALGVRLTLYLADYDQEGLHAVPGPQAPARTVMGLDTSVAGRAYRQLEMVPATGDGEARLWVPIVDGVERLGAMEVLLDDPADLDDPLLAGHLTWVAAIIGHLVTITTNYGDALDAVRRTRPRTPAAELVWQLLPPLTAGTDKIVVTGAVAPSDAVGGDAFDYALSATTAHLAIFDAAGHSLGSGLVAAMAMSAYRSARRNGGRLFDQAMAIDAVVGGDGLAEGRMVTALLAELDLDSGRLRYIGAGHPYPLVVRRGKVVKALKEGRRSVFGMPARTISVGEEDLEPGDWVILYTDGVTEARDHEGTFFGLDRFEDFLEREAGAGHPPPELVRRLMRNVLEHQRHVLQDDATVLVARWGDARSDLTPWQAWPLAPSRPPA
ncbi:PP2C family protein-serine/threonine phosphatase [Georgenia sp. MJ206]|uniref:PP2C family protein-serine/threonine phosphatase n=1 Tax=Georgenia wangjunii TaxID=3117730 RepID=UPI002F268806